MKNISLVFFVLFAGVAHAADANAPVFKAIGDLGARWEACGRRGEQACFEPLWRGATGMYDKIVRGYFKLVQDKPNPDPLRTRLEAVKKTFLEFMTAQCEYEGQVREAEGEPDLHYEQTARCTARVVLDGALILNDVLGFGVWPLPDPDEAPIHAGLFERERDLEACYARAKEDLSAKGVCAREATVGTRARFDQLLKIYHDSMAKGDRPQLLPASKAAQKEWVAYRRELCEFAAEFQMLDVFDRARGEFVRQDCLFKLTHARVREIFKLRRPAALFARVTER